MFPDLNNAWNNVILKLIQSSYQKLIHNTTRDKKNAFSFDETGQNAQIYEEVLFFMLRKTKQNKQTEKTNNQFNLSCVSWMWEAGGRKRARDSL